MNDNRIGGILVIAGSVAGLITMAVHPTGHGAMFPAEVASMVKLNRAAHALAIAGLPLLFLGAVILTRQLAASGRSAWAALVFYGFGAVAIMISAAMSGFVASDVMSKVVAGDPMMPTRQLLLEYGFRINQAFASIYVVAISVAIILWSMRLTRMRSGWAALGCYGWALGLLTIGFLFSGNLSLNVHGFGLVVLGQSIWFIAAGIFLMGNRAARSSAEVAANDGG